MKKNKKILIFLILNSLTSSFAVSKNQVNKKYDKLFTNMTKNIEKGKSNNNNYKLIQEVLNKRNKELKDLYLQGDHIIKPEYLEWQVFSGFYNYSDKGGSKKEREIPFVENNGKVIDLGVVIPIKGKTVKEIDLNVISPIEPIVDINLGNITTPIVDKPDFNFIPMEIPSSIQLNSNFSSSVAGESYSKIGINTNKIQYNTSGLTIYENLNTASSGKTLFEIDSNGTLDITGATSYNNGVVTGTTLASYIYGSSIGNTFSVMSIGINGNYTISGDWELRSKVSPSYILNEYGFMSYRPYYITSDGKVEFTGNLYLTASTETARQKVGLYLDLENKTNLPEVTATLENKGVITVTDTGTAMQINASTKNGTVSGNLINSGTINLNSTNGTYNYHATGIQVLLPNTSESGKAVVKIGNINVNGLSDDGVKIRGYYGSVLEAPSNVIIDGSDGIIILNGEKNQGVSINKNMGSSGSINTLDNIKNLNIIVNGLTGVGIVISPSETIQSSDYILNNKMVESIVFGPNSRSSAFFSGINFSQGKSLILDKSLKNAIGIIDAGTMNTIITTDTASTVINNVPIEITANANAMYTFTTQKVIPINFIPTPKIINNADIINNSSAYTKAGITYGALGLGALSFGATIINNGNIDMDGKNAIGIYNNGTAQSKSDHIIINNDMGVAVYGSFGNTGLYPEYVVSESIVSANKLEVNGNNGVVLYSEAGDIKLSPLISGGSLEITANGNNTFAFYNETATKNSVARSGKFIINNLVNVQLKNGAIGFYYDTKWGNFNILGYFSNIVDTSNGQLNILTDKNSYKIAIRHAVVNVSDLSNLNIPNMNFVGDTGKIKIIQGKVSLDINSDIDKNNSNGDKTYRDLEIVQSPIMILNGIKITGTEDSLVGISQSAKYNESKNSISNAGTIDLKGNSSIGIYNKRGDNINTGIIDVSGNNGIGMYEVSGYNINTGEIIIKNNGIGMYNTTYLDPADNPYNSSTSNISNNGKIISNGGNKSTGIFSNNNTYYGYINLRLGSSSDIDVSSSSEGIGIYGINSYISSFSSSGKISVGEKGIGLYAKDSTINLLNLELNLIGDEAVGFYLEGTSNFFGTGNINIDGKNITVFNLLNTSYFNQNFSILSTANSSYTFQRLKDLTSYYNSVASLGQGGVFISGLNSAVLLDTNSQLISNNSDLVALALDGSYPGLTYINGISVSNEATNKGKISFGDNSIGLYAKNGASVLNEGIINLGLYSVGLYGIGIGTNITNTGDITIDSNSAGLYLKDGDKLINSGNILSNGDNSVGLFLSGSEISKINNTGEINLSGSGSVGIYNDGTQINTINNNREIIIGDLGVGIFNDNSNGIITNTADIVGATKSVGLYNNGGTMTHLSGDIKTGSFGVNVYTISGTVNLNAGKLNIDDFEEVGIYGKNGANIDNNMELDIAQNNYGIILDNSNLVNRNKSLLSKNSVLLYSKNGSSLYNDIGADIKMNASNSIAFYMVNGGNLVNKAEIIGNNGIANIGIYTKEVNVDNSGDIKIGDSLIIDAKDPTKNFYSVALYNQDSQNFKNTGKIEIGANAFGVYVENNLNKALNSGNIISNANGAVGIYTIKGTLENKGDITLSGDNSIGIVAKLESKILNSGNITINGNNSTGIHAALNSAIINEKTGAIHINGNDSTGIQLSGGSTLENYGKIEVASGTIGSAQIRTEEAQYEIPSIINAGVIKVDEKFDLNGINLTIKADLNSFRVPTIEEIIVNGYNIEDINAEFLLTNSVQIVAPEFEFGTKEVKLDPLFTQGTNARVYKFENVFDPTTPGGGLNSGELTLKSGSLTFDAIPNINSSGKVDIWMEKINYDQFTHGLWYDSFAKNIENKYLNATGDALSLYDKLDLINNINDFDNSMEQLSGKMYANINQREQDIYGVLDNALFTLQNSKNNTKENVKINIIAGKGSSKEDTKGIDSYDYNTVGVLALREVEKTSKHTFGYSLGYTRTDFQIDNSNNKDEANTVQLGLHNKYNVNGWKFRNDLLGRVSFHTSNRSVEWYDGSKSNVKTDYNVYGLTSLNEIGKEINLQKNLKLTPYTGFQLGYMKHYSFKENGDPAKLKIDGNDGYSVKPNVGIRLEAEKSLGKIKYWKLKGNIGVGYEYELGNMNKQEKASVVAIEEGYHKLAKPAKNNGKVRTNGTVGVEIEDRYGIFITGEYSVGEHKEDDYRVGVNLKAVF